MACFTVPVAEAIVTTIVTKVVEVKERKKGQTDESAQKIKYDGKNFEAVAVSEKKIPFSKKLKWLNYMLWGGSALLIFEHVWHGEVVPWFPFLTNAVNPNDALEMMHEISTVGVTMAIAVTAVWAIIVGVVSLIEKKSTRNSVETATK